MPPKGPIVIANKNHSAKGVLPVNMHSQSASAPPSKTTVRLKLQVRRLPPALTKDEFLDALGQEWTPMAGRVDWFEYRPGKTKGIGKISEKSRAYLHLTNESHIKAFEAKFLSLTFQDAKGTHKDPNIRRLQPSLEFAPNQRIPASKQRVDGRQGTIDQDPEFIAFLEAETQPVTKPASLEAAAAAAAAEKSHEKVSSTPLLDDLREKKANKAKATSSKPTKSSRSDPKDEKNADKSAARGGDAESSHKPTKAVAAAAAKSAQAVKDAVKIANKQAARASSTASQSPAPTTKSQQQQQPATSASTRKQRDRVTPSAIKTMLQRDLGLAPTGKRAKAAAAAAAASETAATSSQATAAANDSASTVTITTTTANTKPTAAESSPSSRTEPNPKPSKSSRSRKAAAAEKATTTPVSHDAAKPTPMGPATILKKTAPAQSAGKQAKAKASPQNGAAPQGAATPASNQSPANIKSAKSAPQPSAGAVKAYLKHANASQGITEPLITAALAVFGQVVKVDIDKRKGTALAEFKDHDSLKAAMAKRSVSVAQGAVEVLEFRDRPAPGGGRSAPAPARGGGSTRGKGRAGRGSSVASATAVNTNASAPATSAPVNTSAPGSTDAT